MMTSPSSVEPLPPLGAFLSFVLRKIHMQWAVMTNAQECLGVWVSYGDAAQFVSDNCEYENDIYVVPSEELTSETVLLNA